MRISNWQYKFKIHIKTENSNTIQEHKQIKLYRGNYLEEELSQ